MAVLQVRNMDDRLYENLKRRAEQENRSVSQEVVAIVKSYLSAPCPPGAHPDDAALSLAGTWADERSGEAIAESIRNRRATRRFKGNP